TRFSRDWSSDVCSSDLYTITHIDARRAQALSERPPVVELAVERDVAEGIDVGDRVAVVHEVEAVEHRIGALAVHGERHVVHERGLRPDVPRERDGAPGPYERLRPRALRRGDQVHGAELIGVTPAAPVVELLEVPFDARRWRWRPVGHRVSLPPRNITRLARP